MTKIYVNRYSGILSAYGLSLADLVVEKQEPFCSADIMLNQTQSSSSGSSTIAIAKQRLLFLEDSASLELQNQGFLPKDISIQRYLNLRYEGTDTAMMTTLPLEAEGSVVSCFSSNILFFMAL